MVVIPTHDLIVLPGVTFYFQKEYFQEIVRKEAVVGEEAIFLMLKEDRARSDMKEEDFYYIGASGVIDNIDKDGNVGIKAVSRVMVDMLDVTPEEILVTATDRPDIEDMDADEQKKHYDAVKSAVLQFVQGFQWGIVARNYINQWKTMAEMVCTMSYHLSISTEEKYAIMEADKISVRTALMEKALYEFIEVTKVSNEVQKEQAETHEQLYREEAIRKQIEILQRQLDEMHPENVSDLRKFQQKIQESSMNDTARAEAEKILNRMKQEGENGHEYGMLYDYLDFVTGLCWDKAEFSEIDLGEAEKILDEEHFGLKKVKDRVIQQIAVMALNKKQSGSILLFVGAPGTGKTSIGQSIAKALGRKYVRVSLGGIRDEAEIRGHRRTYVGAMPGRIMDGIKRSGASNPVMVLDEVDKLSHDYSGDPASALLEVLDPEQNSTFTDHYMNVPYDLSDVLFICTANSTDTIPEPLLNRMEVIQFPGYTESEKVQIARRHLLPRAMKTMGIKAANLKVSDEVLHAIISDYTMEAGVRGLKKMLDTLCRTAAVKLVKGEQKSLTVSTKRLREFLDQKPMIHDHILEEKKPGIVTGLAWTQAGGDILFIETLFTKGSGQIIITGQLGDVMKESVQIAVSLAKSMFPDKAQLFEENDLHIHVPAGAVPKDGPSAGITLTTAISSLLSGNAVSASVAMTGEVSLRGVIMPIGGLPEKLMAAVRAGITTVFIPKENIEDLEDVADEIKEKLEIIPVHKVEEVLKKTGVIK
ncbi:endopeptidase La [Blautia sp. HCP3S3_G3]|uniref:endopeptidase La n=1 Tax=Blautia sp. HCP3S3_G3 TaxID=3438913 RepID=UPI003F8CBDA0